MMSVLTRDVYIDFFVTTEIHAPMISVTLHLEFLAETSPGIVMIATLVPLIRVILMETA
jgi:hypothetical protein